MRTRVVRRPLTRNPGTGHTVLAGHTNLTDLAPAVCPVALARLSATMVGTPAGEHVTP